MTFLMWILLACCLCLPKGSHGADASSFPPPSCASGPFGCIFEHNGPPSQPSQPPAPTPAQIAEDEYAAYAETMDKFHLKQLEWNQAVINAREDLGSPASNATGDVDEWRNRAAVAAMRLAVLAKKKGIDINETGWERSGSNTPADDGHDPELGRPISINGPLVRHYIPGSKPDPGLVPFGGMVPPEEPIPGQLPDSSPFQEPIPGQQPESGPIQEPIPGQQPESGPIQEPNPGQDPGPVEGPSPENPWDTGFSRQQPPDPGADGADNDGAAEEFDFDGAAEKAEELRQEGARLQQEQLDRDDDLWQEEFDRDHNDWLKKFDTKDQESPYDEEPTEYEQSDDAYNEVDGGASNYEPKESDYGDADYGDGEDAVNIADGDAVAAASEAAEAAGAADVAKDAAEEAAAVAEEAAQAAAEAGEVAEAALGCFFL